MPDKSVNCLYFRCQDEGSQCVCLCLILCLVLNLTYGSSVCVSYVCLSRRINTGFWSVLLVLIVLCQFVMCLSKCE